MNSYTPITARSPIHTKGDNIKSDLWPGSVSNGRRRRNSSGKNTKRYDNKLIPNSTHKKPRDANSVFINLLTNQNMLRFPT